MNERNTKQKEIILQVIKQDKTHPTIKEITRKVKKIDKTIGQATIYRNVNKLVKDEKIKKLKINTNTYRYDCDISNHSHFLCKKCLQVFDIFNFEINNIDLLEKSNKINIESYSVFFEGICKTCNK